MIAAPNPNLRRLLGRFPGFLSPEPSERALGLYLPGAEISGSEMPINIFNMNR